MERRQFMQSMLASSPLLLLNGRLGAVRFGEEDPIRELRAVTIPILQGMTNETSSQFTVQVNKAHAMRYYVVDEIGMSREVFDVSRVSQSYSDFALDKLFVEHLQPGAKYELVVVAASGEAVDRRRFKTIKNDRSSLRFVFGSCIYDGMQFLAKGIYEQMFLAQPDFIFVIGDTVYMDHRGGDGTVPSMWSRHAETRENLGLFRQKDLVPLCTIWDDHDYGGNGSDRSFRNKSESRSIFEAFFGSRPISGVEYSGFGLGHVMNVFGHRFYLLDGRTYRSSLGDPDQQHWGPDQEDWLLSSLMRSDSPSFLMTGSQYYGGYLQKDSMEFCQPNRLKLIMSEMKRVSAPVVLCSGDVHFSEIMDLEPALLGYPTFELTSSSIHSLTWPFGRKNNDRRLESTWKHNFMLIDSERSEKGFDVHVRCLSPSGQLYFKRDLAVTR